MFDNIILSLREKLIQFLCVHDYKYRDLPFDCSHFYCTKCGKIKKNI